MVQKPLIRRGTAAAANRTGPAAEGNPRMGGVVLVRVRLAPALLIELMLVIVMLIVICPKKSLLILTKPGDSSVCRFLTQRLLSHNSWTVNVVILHMQRLYLVDGINGERMLKSTIGHSTVQQRLRDKGRGHSGDVVGNPGLHVLAGASLVLTLKQHLETLQI